MITLKTFIAEKNSKLSKIVLDTVEGLSYSAFRKILRSKDVKVNGKRVSSDLMVDTGDKIDVYYVKSEPERFVKIYEDENILVIDKKSGFTSESIFDSVKQEYSNACFIHRLDRNTSGIMIFALNAVAEIELLQGFKARTFEKKYLATVFGVPAKKSAVLTAYLVKDKDTATVKIYDNKVNGSVEICTGYTVLSSNDNTSLLEVTLYTGKTHQIRAHLAHIGHFIVGDGKYGDNSFNRKYGAKSQMLKAYKLRLKFKPSDKLFYLNGKTFVVD